MPLGKSIEKPEEDAWWFYHTMTREELEMDVKEFSKWFRQEIVDEPLQKL